MGEQQQLNTGLTTVFRSSAPEDLEAFTQLVQGHYACMKRAMPWRETISPYYVVVSELMLQQTQVPRVLEKFPVFISRFPDFVSLANTPLADVFEAWQGLGYNRRAKYLHGIARFVVSEWGGVLPSDPELLVSLPGIGKATAGSITAFAFNRPVIFIETNIRRVYLHHFFHEEQNVPDSEIYPLLEVTLDHDNPREWYYALMDYGTWLARRTENPNRRSRHYLKQSTFEGSDRQIRGRIIKRLLTEKRCPIDALIFNPEAESPRLRRILLSMVQEGLLSESGGIITIAE